MGRDRDAGAIVMVTVLFLAFIAMCCIAANAGDARSALRRELTGERDAKRAACSRARSRVSTVMFALRSSTTQDAGRLAAMELASWMPFCDGDAGLRAQREIAEYLEDPDVMMIRAALIRFQGGE